MYILWAGPCKGELKGEKLGLLRLLFSFSITFNFHLDLMKLFLPKKALKIIS